MSIKARSARIGSYAWQHAKPDAFAVYNCNYSPSGRRIAHRPAPWTVAGRLTFETFPTHAEAITFAFKEAEK